MPLSTWSRGIRIRENGALTVVPSVVTGSGRITQSASVTAWAGLVQPVTQGGRSVLSKPDVITLVSVRGQ